MLLPNFIGPAYRSRSATIAADTLKNLYPEIAENKSDVKQATYYGTPGLKLFLAVGTHRCRGQYSQDALTLAVYGGMLYQINIPAATSIPIGAVPDDNTPVFFASNGRGGEQVALLTAGKLYIYSTSTSTFTGPVVLPLSNPGTSLDFLNGYFILSEANTVRVWYSALENGLSWNALNFFAVSRTSTNVIGVKVLRDLLWVFQSQTALVYYDSGDSLNPFVPYPGSVMQEGAVNAYSIAVLGESVYWCAQDNQGRHRFVSATTYAPTVISTPPISFALASYPAIDTVEVLAYEQEGHPFVVWTIPGQQTWAWDTREQQWHERTSMDIMTGSDLPWRARGTASNNGLIFVGDAFNGNLYTLDLDTFQDNGQTIARERTAPYLSAENQWLFLDRVELGIQAGVGLLDGSDPQVMLSLSRDSGETWTPPVATSMGKIGSYLTRAIWRRLGRARADRLVIKIRQTDPVRAVWGPGLWVKARPGSGAL